MKPAIKKKILNQISKSAAEDFDGHTDFKSLTPRQKLEWLSSTAYFVYTMGTHNPAAGCARFLKK